MVIKQNPPFLENLKKLLATLIEKFRSGVYILRRESAIALSKFKGERATDFLLETYESDNIQDFLALALGNLENEKAISLLIQALNDSQCEVRFNAARALGMIKNNEAFNVLMEALNEYADNIISGGAGENQGRLFFEEETIISAITSLGQLKNHLSNALLKRILAQEKSPRIRSAVIMALGNMATERMLPIFQAALRDEDSRVRANAIEAIEAIKSSSVVGILQPYLEDSSNRVRANVAKAIWRYGDFDVSDTISEMLASGDKWQRASAAYALGEIRDVRFIQKLAMALTDPDNDVRRNSAHALKKIESPEAFPFLEPLLDDPSPDVRVQAVLAISRCVPDRIMDVLPPRLAGETNSVVLATLVSSLGDSGNPECLKIISPFLDNGDARVVANAIDSLQKLFDKNPGSSVTKKVEASLSHDDNRVKSNAIKALWHWKQYTVLDDLHVLFSNPDSKSQLSAIFVLGEIGYNISLESDMVKVVNELIVQLLSDEHHEAPPKKEAEPCVTPEVDTSLIDPLPPTLPSEASFDEELEKAAFAANAKEYSLAERIYQKILKTLPNHLKAILGMGNIAFLLKRYPEATIYFKKALSINPSLVKAHYNLGTIFFFEKDFDMAKSHLLDAIKLYPKLLGAYLILAQIFQIQGKSKESIDLLSKAIKLSPRNPILYQKLALLYLHIKEFSKAIEVLLQAVALAPLDVESNILLAFSFQKTGNHEKAFGAIDNSLQSCVQSPNPDEALRILMQNYIYFKTNVDTST